MRLHLSDDLLVDASEFLHAVYDDLNQINDILSLQDPTLQIEGTAFFFNGFEVLSSLEPVYLQALSRAAFFHGFFERSFINTEEVIVDTFSMDTSEYGMMETVSANSSLCGDEEYVDHYVTTNEAFINEEK